MDAAWRGLAEVIGSTSIRASQEPSRWLASRVWQAESGYPSGHLECHTQAGRSQEGEVRMALMRYMVVVERGETSWGAHVPDLPGCVAVGESREEVLRLIREAIEFHIDGLRQEGLPIPAPSSEGVVVEVAST